MSVNRRKFIQASACGFGATLLSSVPALSNSPRSQIDIITDHDSLGTISPDLYGYLLENLGTVIYDGIWVGEKSKIDNVSGIRRAVIDCLRDIKASVIRWPGGNFADYYNWEDGIGPRAKRPRRTNVWDSEYPADVPIGPQRYDPNLFGTPEFMQLCRLSGGRPFLSVNVRSLTPQSFYEWVDYCNSLPGTTTLADKRRQDGSSAPYGVRYFGIGNEVWAAGGCLTAAEYATLYKRFSTNAPRYGQDISLIAAGPPPGWNTEWIHEFMRACTGAIIPVPVGAMSLHYYAALPLNYLNPRSTALDVYELNPARIALLNGTEFGLREWYQTLYASAQLQRLLDGCWETLGIYDVKRAIKIALDEWGAIYQRTPTRNPANLTGRGVTMRDALAAAITLDILNINCSRLSVANYTGLINQEGGILQADGVHFCTTPVYHVFKMYSAHQGGKALQVLFDVPSIGADETQQPGSLATLSGSASIQMGMLTLTVTNAHASQSLSARINIRGANATTVTVSIISADDIHAQNTFETPDNIAPKSEHLTVNGGSFEYSFPPASVISFTTSLRTKG